MKFILYLLICVGEALGVSSWGSTDSYRDAWIGLAVIIVVFGSYVLLVFLLNRTSLSRRKVYLFSVLIVLAIIVIFCVISILIEFLVK